MKCLCHGCHIGRVLVVRAQEVADAIRDGYPGVAARRLRDLQAMSNYYEMDIKNGTRCIAKLAKRAI